MAVVARRVVVSGRVQGVGYREFARRAADALGLRGWVRNRRDGTVEAWVEGEEEAVSAFLERCRAGPSLSAVAAVAADPGAPPGRLGLRGAPHGVSAEFGPSEA